MNNRDSDALAAAIAKPLVGDDDRTFMARVVTGMSRRNARRTMGRLGLIAAASLAVALAALTAKAVLAPLFDAVIGANPLLGLALGLGVLGAVIVAVLMIGPE